MSFTCLIKGAIYKESWFLGLIPNLSNTDCIWIVGQASCYPKASEFDKFSLK